MKIREIEQSSIIRDKLEQAQSSPLRAYIHLTAGNVSLMKFLLYEFITCFIGPLPGGIGFFMRKQLYPMLFKSVGRGFILGRNTVIRHPDKIRIGNNVTIDDNCMIDGRGAGDEGIVIEDNAIINRNCMLLAKSGPIHIGERTSIGSDSVIVSMDGVSIGKAVLTAGGISISAGLYHFEDPEKPVMDQGAYTKGPVNIGQGAWLGTHVTILDGVTIGDGAVIGAGAIVNKDIPANMVAFGVPAKVIRSKT